MSRARFLETLGIMLRGVFGPPTEVEEEQPVRQPVPQTDTRSSSAELREAAQHAKAVARLTTVASGNDDGSYLEIGDHDEFHRTMRRIAERIR